MQCFFGALNELISLTLKTGAAFALLRFKRQLFFQERIRDIMLSLLLSQPRREKMRKTPFFWGIGSLREAATQEESVHFFWVCSIMTPVM